MIQMKALAIEKAEEMMQNGTASSQIITYFLKSSPEKEALELDNLRKENELLQAKISQINAEKTMQQLAADAINAMRVYSGANSE